MQNLMATASPVVSGTNKSNAAVVFVVGGVVGLSQSECR